MKKNTPKYVIGIDFGSTFSAVSIMKIGSMDRPRLIKFGDSEMVSTALAVKTSDDGEFKVEAWGNGIRKDQISPTTKIVEHFKRYLGYEGDSKEGDYDFDLKKNAATYSLLFLKKLAEHVRGKEGTLSPDRFVTCVAHPAGWSDSRIALLKKLVKAAGFPEDQNGIRTIEEPVAAMHSLRVSEKSDLLFGNDPEKSMVIDFGGGTLDVCIVETDIKGKAPIIPKNGKGGDSELGGKDFDEKLKVRAKNKLRDELKPFSEKELSECCRKNKEDASEAFSGGAPLTRFRLPPYEEDDGFEILKSDLVEQDKDSWKGDFSPLIEKFQKCIVAVLGSASLVAGDIKNVILTGGSSQWFFIRQLLEERFSFDRKNIHRTENPYTDVVIGAAVAWGRTDEVGKIPGVWVQCCCNPKGGDYGKWEWSEPICLKKASKTQSEEPVPMQELNLSSIETQYLFAHRIAVRFLEGYEKANLKPKDKPTVIEFYARKNFPFVKRLSRFVKAFTNEPIAPVEDQYRVYVQYKPKTGKSYLRVYNASGGDPIEVVELIPDRITYRSKLGCGARREESLRLGDDETK